MFALEHEVDAEEGGGEDIEDVREPERERGEEITGGGVEGSGGALGEGVEAELVGHGELLDAGDDGGNALGKVGGEVAEVAEDGRKAEGEEEGKYGGDGDDEKDDGNGAGALFVGSEVVGCGDGQLGISLGADCWMQVVCAFGG